MNSGVYCIKNKVNRKRYIGSTARTFKERFIEHRKNLRGKRHPNPHLQAAWNKYGEENFDFIVMDRTVPDYCIISEQWCMDEFKPEYNINPEATHYTKWTPESRKRLSEAKIKFYSNPILSKHARNVMKIINKNKIFTDLTRKRMSESAKKRNRFKESYPVKQICPITNNVIKIWPSSSCATKTLFNIKRGCGINTVCCKRPNSKTGKIIETYKGFKWEYV